MTSNSKIVVFDLDETLGYFTELGMFWDSLNSYIKDKNINISINQTLFDNILDLYPEFLRPDIINILKYIKTKKQNNKCDKIMLYTNNQGPMEWAKYIIKYFENKLNYKLFDKIIAAFKVKGETIEVCRTSHLKSHSDFIKCTKLPINTHICFLDDVLYPDMKNDNIYYIHLKPYVHDLSFDELIKRFIKSNIIKNNDNSTITNYFLEHLNKYNYIFIEKTKDAQNLDKIITKRILEHIHKIGRAHV